MQTDVNREKDIIELCKQVLNAIPNVYYNPNGADQSTCPFCQNKTYSDEYDISKLQHDTNCAYLIAKDLTTNIKI